MEAVIHSIALWGTGIASAGFLTAILVGIFVSRTRGLQLGAACLSILVGCQLLFFFGSHLLAATLLGVAGVLLLIGVWAWRHLPDIETATGLDVNRDGKVG